MFSVPPTWQHDRDPGDENAESPTLVLDLDIMVWRFDQLLAAGYDHEAAQIVAGSGADLHVACDLLGNGATVQEALRILL